ncbi:TPM domain-containing protein [soil metagenome]
MKDQITEAQEQQIVQAIQEAERNTSGEIRVHIENVCQGNELDRAVEVFADLHMHQTKFRNGVLFYVALESHHFAVIGDGGINAVVPDNFWDEVKNLVLTDFKAGQYVDGLAKGIQLAGQQLKSYFPYDQKGDTNELKDNVSFGDQ